MGIWYPALLRYFDAGGGGLCELCVCVCVCGSRLALYLVEQYDFATHGGVEAVCMRPK